MRASPLLGVLIIAAMAIGSIVMWLCVPLGWIFLASRLVSSSQPNMGVYVGLLVVIPLSMFAVGKGLAALNRLYGQVTHSEPVTTRRVTAPWLRSMRGERDSGRPRQVLDVVMIWSVGLAALCFGIWFFAFAGSPV